LAENEALADYQVNSIPKTIKAVLDESPNKRWSGSSKNLIDAGERIFQMPIAPSSQSLGKSLAALKDLLYEQDKIIYTISPNGNAGSIHNFCYAVAEDDTQNEDEDECPEF
jgi:hypothetical protein